MPAAKKKKPSKPSEKPSAAAVARAALDAEPPRPSDDAVPPIERRRSAVEQARPPPRLLSASQVLGLVPISYPTLWAMMLRNEFPRSRQLAPGSNRVAWLESEVLAWIDSRPLQRLKGDEEPERSK
jgi:predicted DNA-binding transcriptional regulator AlpA